MRDKHCRHKMSIFRTFFLGLDGAMSLIIYRHIGITASPCRKRKEISMDTTTLLLIVIVLLLIGGGGYYGRSRWF